MRTLEDRRIIHWLARGASQGLTPPRVNSSSHRPAHPPGVVSTLGSPSRRGFLKGTAGLAGALFLGGRPKAFSANDPGYSVAVIGAGMAGVTATYRLAQAGLKAHLFEASNRVGGRMWTDGSEFIDGQYVERGGEWINGAHRTMIGLAQELGLSLKYYYTGEEEGTEGLIIINGTTYSIAEAIEDIEVLKSVARRQAARIRGNYYYDNANDFAIRIDNMSAAEWLDEYVPGGVDSDIASLMSVVTRSQNGGEIDDISGLLMLSMAQFATSEVPKILAVGAAPAFTIEGGNQQMVTRMFDQLAPEQTTFGRWLVAARTLSDGRTTLTFDGDSGVEERTYDRVILALPINTLKNVDISELVIPGLRRELIRDLSAGNNSKLAVQFDTRFWVDQGSTGGVSGEVPFQSSYHPTVHQAGAAGILASYTGGDWAGEMGAQSATQRGAEFVNQLEAYLPGAGAAYNGRTSMTVWSDRPYQLGAYTNMQPGRITRFLGYGGVQAGTVHFAGEYTSTVAWGYMEGAAESGERAAQEVLRGLGLR